MSFFPDGTQTEVPSTSFFHDESSGFMYTLVVGVLVLSVNFLVEMQYTVLRLTLIGD